MSEQSLYGKEYGQTQDRRLPDQYLDIIGNYLPISKNEKVLELGVGGGELLPFLKKFTAKAFGIDINSWLLTNKKNENTAVADGIALPLADNSFDKSLSVHTIEHIPDLKTTFKELDRITKPGGSSLHIFPAPLFHRAEGAMIDTLKMYPKQPLKAFVESLKYHVHKLNPEKIEDAISGTNWKINIAEKKFIKGEGFSWVVLLNKK